MEHNEDAKPTLTQYTELVKQVEILTQKVKQLSHELSRLQDWRNELVGGTTKELLEKEFYLGWHIPNKPIIENIEDYTPKEITEDVEPLVDRFTKEANGTAVEKTYTNWDRKSNEYECRQMEMIPEEKIDSDIDKLISYLRSDEHKEAEQREYDYWKAVRKKTVDDVSERIEETEFDINRWYTTYLKNSENKRSVVYLRDVDEIVEMLKKIKEIGNNEDINKE